MRNYCDHKKIYLEMSADLHVLIPLEYEKVTFGMPSICMYLYVSVYVYMDGWIFMLKILSLRYG
jgi:hypothetical protein